MNGITTQTTLSHVLDKLLKLNYIKHDVVDRLKVTVFKGLLGRSLEYIKGVDIEKRVVGTQRIAYDISIFITAFKKISNIYMSNPFNHLKKKKSTPRLNHQTIDTISECVFYSRYLPTEFAEDLYKAIILVFSLALRTSETLNIRYSDINYDIETIKIRKTKNCPEGRMLPFSGIFPEFKKELMMIFSSNKSDDFVLFTNTRHCSDGALSARLADGLIAIRKIMPTKKEFQFRDLRSTYAALAANAGISENAIANFMGHKDTVTTSKHYSRNVQAKIEFPDYVYNERLL